MRKALSLLLCCVIFISCSFGLSGCIFNRENPYPYLGEYKELYTVAVYSIPDAEGYMHHGEGAYDSEIYIWETDDYGRVLFSYCEDDSYQFYGLLIAQAYDENNVYFYPDVNYEVALIDSEDRYEIPIDIRLKTMTEDFYLEKSENLKAQNDWNKPLDKTKCVSYPITDHKALGEKIHSLKSTKCDEILNDYSKTLNLPNPERFPHRYNEVLQVDAEGKILHQIYGVHQHHDNPNWKKGDKYTSYSIILWVITDKDGNYDKENGVMVILSKENNTESYTYNAEDVLKFKKKNNWTYSHCKE